MPRARVAIAVAFFAYVLLIRTHDITSTFLMLGEQARDWTIALGGWRDIPLTGTPSTAGGRGFGPIYYWMLWIGRHLIGPFTGNLPHTGGITVALLQSAADTWLLVALWRRVHVGLALAMCVLIASAPFDIGLSAVIWNPPVSAALVKMAIAQMITLGRPLVPAEHGSAAVEGPALWKIGATATTAWLAVQAHSSAIFVAAPLLAALVAPALIVRQWRRALRVGALIVAVVLTLQVPYIVAQLREPEATVGPAVVFDSMANAAQFELMKAFTAVVNATGDLLVHRMGQWRFQIVTLIAAAIVAWRWRRDLGLLAVSVGALATATVLFSTWTRPYDSYWFLTLTPAMVLTYGLAVAAIPRAPILQWTSLTLLAIVIVWQPSRIEESKGFFKYPPYGIMVSASRELARVAPVLRDIRINFAGAHPTMDKYFIYRILGGRIEPGAPIAYIDEGGHIRVE